MNGSDEFLDVELAGVVERRASGSLCGVLNFCSIVDRSVTVRGVLRFLGGEVIELGAEIGNVAIQCKAAGALIIVPLDIDFSIEVSFFIDCYFIFFFEGVEQMIGLALAYIFNTKVINYEGKQERSPFVAPQTRGEGALVVVMLEKARL